MHAAGDTTSGSERSRHARPGAKRSALLLVSALALAAVVLSALGHGLFAPAGGAGAGAPPKPAAPGRFEVIDVHVHTTPSALPRLLELMRQRGIQRVVNLSGGTPLSGLDEQLAAAAHAPGKIIVFTTLAYLCFEYVLEE